jgi:hypothetical protein
MTDQQDQLLELFRSYNPDVWPLPLVAYLLAIAALVLNGKRPSGDSDRFVAGFLALLWIWLGIVFQGIYVRDVDPVLGIVYAALFIVEAVLIARAGVWRRQVEFRPTLNWTTVLGALAIFYGLAIYPLLGIVFGHSYPEGALFGTAPCPTTIVTFGLFLFARPPLPKHLLLIPFVWAVLAPLAAVPQGVVEDSGLFIVGIVATVLIVIRDRTSYSTASARPASRVSG